MAGVGGLTQASQPSSGPGGLVSGRAFNRHRASLLPNLGNSIKRQDHRTDIFGASVNLADEPGLVSRSSGFRPQAWIGRAFRWDETGPGSDPGTFKPCLLPPQVPAGEAQPGIQPARDSTRPYPASKITHHSGTRPQFRSLREDGAGGRTSQAWAPWEASGLAQAQVLTSTNLEVWKDGLPGHEARHQSQRLSGLPSCQTGWEGQISEPQNRGGSGAGPALTMDQDRHTRCLDWMAGTWMELRVSTSAFQHLISGGLGLHWTSAPRTPELVFSHSTKPTSRVSELSLSAWNWLSLTLATTCGGKDLGYGHFLHFTQFRKTLLSFDVLAGSVVRLSPCSFGTH